MISRVYGYIIRKFYRCIFAICNRTLIISGKGTIKKIHCTNYGRENALCVDAGASLSDCKILFKGSGNNLVVHCGTHLKNVTFWFEGDDNRIEVGKMVTMEGNVELDACEGCSIIIGDDCMFSHSISVRTTDSHSIVDIDGKRINPAKDIVIGNHVWVGMESIILKGSCIPDNSIVGARSMVTSSLKAKSGSLVAGSPAKLIREDIDWRREML